MPDSASPSFGPQLFQFLHELTGENDKAFWKANKDRYERDVRGPALEFIEAMGPQLRTISPHFLAVAKKSGGSLMRPFRDTRFSRDKTPYKTNVGIQFRHAAGRDVHAPGWYLHLSAEECFLGVGMWRPESSALRAVREGIVGQSELWLETRGAVEAAGWTLGGDSLKRAPKDFDKDHPLIEDLRRKDHVAVRDLEIDEILDVGFLEDVVHMFRSVTAYMRFLTEAVGQPF